MFHFLCLAVNIGVSKERCVEVNIDENIVVNIVVNIEVSIEVSNRLSTATGFAAFGPLGFAASPKKLSIIGCTRTNTKNNGSNLYGLVKLITDV